MHGDRLDLVAALADERHRDRVRAARQSRLAALARCCRPATWWRLVRRALTFVRREVRPAASGVPCCA